MGEGPGPSAVTLRLPSAVVEKLRSARVDVESLVVDLVVSSLNLEPEEELEVRRELAKRFLEEGAKLIEKDPVQASEKLYKAAEEAVKALALKHGLRSVVERAGERGRWRAEDLFDAVSELRRVYGDDVRRWWSTAWELHAWGFHEAKATKRYVEERVRDVEELVKLATEWGSAARTRGPRETVGYNSAARGTHTPRGGP